MKVLICPNLASGPHSREASVNWLKETVAICRKSDGVIELFIVVDNGNQKLVKKAGLPYLSLNTIDKPTLAKIREKEFSFDAIFVKGRNYHIELAAKQLGVLHLAFGSEPWPLDVWIAEPTWPKNTADRANSFQTAEPSIDSGADCLGASLGARSGFLGILPLCQSDYNRYIPYIGQAADLLYAPETTCVLLPLYDHFKQTVSQSNLSRILVYIKSLAVKNRDLFFLIAPMSKSSDRMKSLLGNSGANTVWLKKANGRRQILSLIEKSAATLAIDTTSALVPLFMGKPVCHSTDFYGDFIGELPQLDDWLSGTISAAQMVATGERLARRALSYHVIPKNPGSLIRYLTNSNAGATLPINDPAYWNKSRNFEQENLEVRQSTALAFVRKWQKLGKDPYAFFNDSRHPMIRQFRAVFRPSEYKNAGLN